MPPSVFQLLDDIVKIGLGALVAGIFAWLVARHGSKSTMDKMRFERRSALLLDCVEAYEAFFQAFYAFTSQLGGFQGATDAARSAGVGPEWVQDPINGKPVVEKCFALQIQLTEKLKASMKAHAHLMLLGERKCDEAAKGLDSAIWIAVDRYKFNGNSCDMSHHEQSVKTVISAREAFYKALRETFDRI